MSVLSHPLGGIAASPGYAIAQVIKLESEQYVPEPLRSTNAEEQIARLHAAIEGARSELEVIRALAERKLGAEKAEIFEGHLLLLEDPDLIEGTEQLIRDDSVHAEYALHTVANQFIEMLLELDNDLLRERAVDIRDVTGRMMSHLRGIPHPDLSLINEPCIIIGHDLTPSETAQLNLEYVQAFVTEIGSRTSHSAIMARSLDIPALVGVGPALHDVPAGSIAIVDAMNGTLVIAPTQAQIEEFTERKRRYEERRQQLLALKDQPTTSADGHHVELAANIGSVEDVNKALEYGAEGVGLFRTEFLYMGRQSFPTEDEQYISYKTVLEKMAGKPVVIRTLDIGGDKELSYMSMPHEMNPFLGQRALRLCLDRTDLFRTQLRALLRASVHGNLKIMFPMVAVLRELKAAKALLHEERVKLLNEGIPVSDTIEVGIMIEVPAAAITSDLLAKEADFFSIGTNDLIQYTMAADRMNENVSYLYQPCHPTILRLVNLVIKGAKQSGKWTGMCGEMAGDPIAVPLLLGLGLDEFSMSASSILENRELISKLSYTRWKEVAAHCLTLSSQEEVIEYVNQQLHH